MTSTVRPHFPGLRPVPDPHDAEWTHARDSRLTAFITARMRTVELTGCAAELRALGWVLTVLPAWAAARECGTSDPTAAACLDALGWALRQTAHGCWSRHPEWEAAFHPQAEPPHRAEARA